MRKSLIALFALVPLCALACDSDPAIDSPAPDAMEASAPETVVAEETVAPGETVAPSETTAEVEEAPPYLMSRYGPTQGLPGIWVTILTAFDSRGCSAAGTCAVTFSGVSATIASDEYALEVIVPQGASTGPLCVTWRDRTECGEDFTVLTAPLLYAVDPDKIYVGDDDITLVVTGDGFMSDSIVLFEGQRLDTLVVSPYELRSSLPAAMFETAGPRSVSVLSPSLARCGVQSEAVDFLVLE